VTAVPRAGSRPPPTRRPRAAPPIPSAPGGPDGPGRRRARRGEGERLRDEILDAASALLVEHGSVDKVSTRAVARRVGCSSPALYLHFPDKAALVYAVCERQFQQLGTFIDEAIVGLADPLDRLRRGAHAYADFAVAHPEQYRVMMMDDTYAYAFEATLDELESQPGMASTVQAITDGIDAGVLAPGDPRLIAVCLWATIHGVVSLALAKPGIALPAVGVLLDLAVTQNLEGLRTR
jgi:AcrR family transcriptional regulator